MHYHQVEGALLHLVLTEPKSCTENFRNLQLIVHDRFRGIIQKIIYLASNQTFDRLDETVTKQLLWFSDKLTENHSQCEWVPDIYIWLMKQICGGSTSPFHIWLATTIIESIKKNLCLIINVETFLNRTFDYSCILCIHSLDLHRTIEIKLD